MVLRVQSTSAAIASGQNCLHLAFGMVTLSKFEGRVGSLLAMHCLETVLPDTILGLERSNVVLSGLRYPQQHPAAPTKWSAKMTVYLIADIKVTTDGWVPDYASNPPSQQE